MEQLYICTSTGKKDNQPYSVMTKIICGKKKDSNDTYAFIDDKSTIREAEEIKLGTILSYQTTRTVAAKA